VAGATSATSALTPQRINDFSVNPRCRDRGAVLLSSKTDRTVLEFFDGSGEQETSR
jgi:hypothetical protein